MKKSLTKYLQENLQSSITEKGDDKKDMYTDVSEKYGKYMNEAAKYMKENYKADSKKMSETMSKMVTEACKAYEDVTEMYTTGDKILWNDQEGTVQSVDDSTGDMKVMIDGEEMTLNLYDEEDSIELLEPIEECSAGDKVKYKGKDYTVQSVGDEEIKLLDDDGQTMDISYDEKDELEVISEAKNDYDGWSLERLKKAGSQQQNAKTNYPEGSKDRKRVEDELAKIVAAIKKKKVSEAKKDNPEKIDNEAEFRDYAEKFLKDVHGDEFDEKIAQKMINDFVKKFGDDGKWGDAVGAMQMSVED